MRDDEYAVTLIGRRFRCDFTVAAVYGPDGEALLIMHDHPESPMGRMYLLGLGELRTIIERELVHEKGEPNG